jgi:hypothetical protein
MRSMFDRLLLAVLLHSAFDKHITTLNVVERDFRDAIVNILVYFFVYYDVRHPCNPQ